VNTPTELGGANCSTPADSSHTKIRFDDTPGVDLRGLRVLHILDHSLPLHSGYTFRTKSILEIQKERGWQPVALTSPKHEASCTGPIMPVEEIAGFRFYRSGSLPPGRVPFSNELQLIWRLARRIEEVAEIEKPAILHAHSPVLNALATLRAGWKLGIPVVYEIRAFWEDAAVDHRTYAENSAKYKIVKALETWVCRRVNQVTVLCNGIRGALIERGVPQEKLTVIFNGINPGDFRSLPRDEEMSASLGIDGRTVLGFVGSFYRYEGLDVLIKAFAKLSGTRDDLALLLVGGGEMEGELKEQIAKSSKRLRVVIPGRFSHDKIPGIYSLIDILVYPRYSMRLTELVTPLKPLEAMAMGKPLVASNVGGHRELVQDGFTGLLFRPGDADDLAKKLGQLLDQPEIRQKLAWQANGWVRQNHTWSKTTAVYSTVYSRALSRH
jgi:PEP-CTERM/exosortase A-associated glycosyltransferase